MFAHIHGDTQGDKGFHNISVHCVLSRVGNDQNMWSDSDVLGSRHLESLGFKFLFSNKAQSPWSSHVFLI